MLVRNRTYFVVVEELVQFNQYRPSRPTHEVAVTGHSLDSLVAGK